MRVSNVFCKSDSKGIRAVQTLQLQIFLRDFIMFYVILFRPCPIQLEVFPTKQVTASGAFDLL